MHWIWGGHDVEGVDKDDASVDWLVNAARFEVKIDL